MPNIHVTGAIDSYTRCRHYHSELDIIAIKFPCCDTYYGCYECHVEFANHSPKVWQWEDAEKKAILCGNCGTELSIRAYLTSGVQCPSCEAPFNPRCENHYALYFAPELVASCTRTENSFTERAVAVIRSIPPGRVMTYGQIAELAGNRRGARQIVRILHSLSTAQQLPWHRIVNAKGEIRVPDEKTRSRQIQLLQAEGIAINEAAGTIINLEQVKWNK